MHPNDERLKEQFLEENPEYRSQARYVERERRWVLKPPAHREWLIWLAVKGILAFEDVLELNVSASKKQTSPHDLTAERRVIGSMLLWNSIIGDVLAIVKPADFHDPQAACMCREIFAMQAEGIAVDAVKLATRMGESYVHPISQALDSVTHLADASRYANIVREMAARR